MAKFFIERPIFAWVVAIFIMIAGVLGISKLPIAQYPSVAAPTITLTATYPGASAQVLEDSVLAVLERNMMGVEGLDTIETSASSNGVGTVKLTFTPETDENFAQVDVQNKVSEVTPLLPSAVQQNGVSVSKARSNFLMIVMLTSKTMSVADMSDYAQRNVIPELQRIEGVGSVQLFGSQRAMRIWVNPAKLKGYNLSFADVSAAISAQNAQISAGALGAQPADSNQQITATITAEGQLKTVEEFGNIMLRSTTDGANVYLKDVARIELGSQSYGSEARLNGVPTTGMAVSLSNSGNALATAQAVEAKMNELKPFFPAGVEWKSPYNTSQFVALSINKVVSTLVEAVGLVFIVMFIFLQNFRYTVIPTIVVPISILGAFAAISALGMSINVMTMFAMVLVIGIVVDDAIVVVENVERIMAEEGLSPKEATKKAMSQISGAVIGITAVLISVFVPMTQFSGATGNIYYQFAATMAFAIGFSAFLALSLTPALCATMLKPIPKGQHHHEKKGFFGWFNRKFDKLTRRYSSWIGRILRRTLVMGIVYLALTAGAVYSVMRLPTSFIPSEDQGFVMTSLQLPAGATKERTDASLKTMTDIALAQPEVKNIITVSGFSFSGSGQNMAMGFAMLKPWNERGAGSDANTVAKKIMGSLMAKTEDGFALSINPPPIMELGNDSGFGFYLQDRNGAGHEALLAKRNELLAKMRQNSQMFNAQNTRALGLEDAPQLKIDINREAAAAQGISLTAIRQVLGMAMGSAYINDFPNNGRLQRVIVQADAKNRMQPEDVLALTVPNNQGVGVPLATVAHVSWVNGIEQAVRFNGYSAMQITGSPANGKSTGEAMAEVQRLVDEMDGFSLEWAGQSREQAKGSAQTMLLYGFSLIFVFLVLAALYESWSIPFAVLLVVPLGILGVGLGAALRNFVDWAFQMALISLGKMPPQAMVGDLYLNDIYFQVGMITVMGLSAKNAILIIEFAKDLQAEGMNTVKAALVAAKLRLRPILMTSFAFIVGVIPLYLATGASSASQRAIGTSVLWGMFIGTFLSVFLVPLFYVAIRKIFPPTKHEVEFAMEHHVPIHVAEDDKWEEDLDKRR
ncbi:MAG: efflux RND transporter permease subunit [Alysiella sp.]|uniref:efflux RND transporter permease subunit n=1 Tax=Alysiella sp. TaxID=1872483 RepID=UPI0026DD1B2D|nr:efflux RND transporter permease subunit [Alysiella sp.]MDO4434631.1 efflux RND transporter permease subunit [Alysiella sp.]